MLKYSLLAGVSFLTMAAGVAPDIKKGEYQITGVGSTVRPGVPNGWGDCQIIITTPASLASSGQSPSMFYYAGSGKSGSMLHFFVGYSQASQSATGLLTVTLPTAPVSGVSNWSGNATVNFAPIYESSSNPITVTNLTMPFNINFVRGDDFWFQGTYSITFPDGCALSNIVPTGTGSIAYPLLGMRTGTY